MSWDSGGGKTGGWDASAPGGGWGKAPTRSGLGFSQIFRTGILMAGLIALLVVIGNMIGGRTYMFLFGAIGVLFNLGAWWFSDRLALAVHRAQPADPARHAKIFEMVEELSGRAGMPAPKLYVIPSMTPNAFATGRSPTHSAVAVTEGILRILTPRELRGVIAHELAHVRNRDTLISTIAASIAGLISSVGMAIRWGFILGHGRRDDDRGGGLEMLAVAIVAPLVAMIVQLAISRSREYGADETGARICGDPDALADALLRLERGVEAIPYEHAGAATAHLFIVNPFSGRALLNLLSTHPATEERVRRLRAMSMRVA